MQVQNNYNPAFGSINKYRVIVNGNLKKGIAHKNQSAYKLLAGTLFQPGNKPRRIETAKEYASIDPNDYGFEMNKNKLFVMDKSFMYEGTKEHPYCIFKMATDEKKGTTFFISGEEANRLDELDNEVGNCLRNKNMERAEKYKKVRKRFEQDLINDYYRNVKNGNVKPYCIDILLKSDINNSDSSKYGSYTLEGIKIHEISADELINKPY